MKEVIEIEMEEMPACECCGRFDALAQGDRSLCEECASACCAEVGAEDPWRFDDSKALLRPGENTPLERED